jgi:hypothetical protein
MAPSARRSAEYHMPRTIVCGVWDCVSEGERRGHVKDVAITLDIRAAYGGRLVDEENIELWRAWSLT